MRRRRFASELRAGGEIKCLLLYGPPSFVGASPPRVRLSPLASRGLAGGAELLTSRISNRIIRKRRSYGMHLDLRWVRRPWHGRVGGVKPPRLAPPAHHLSLQVLSKGLAAPGTGQNDRIPCPLLIITTPQQPPFGSRPRPPRFVPRTRLARCHFQCWRPGGIQCWRPGGSGW